MTSNRRRSRTVRAAMTADGHSYAATGRRLDRERAGQNPPPRLTGCPRPQQGEGLAGWLTRVSLDLGLDRQQTLHAVGLGSQKQSAAEHLRSVVADPDPTWAVMERFAAATGLEPSDLSEMIAASRAMSLGGAPDPAILAQARAELAAAVQTAMDGSCEPDTAGYMGCLQIDYEPHELDGADITEIKTAVRQAGRSLGWEASLDEHTRYLLVEDLRELPPAAAEAFHAQPQRTTSKTGRPGWMEEAGKQPDSGRLPVHGVVRQLLDRIALCR